MREIGMRSAAGIEHTHIDSLAVGPVAGLRHLMPPGPAVCGCRHHRGAVDGRSRRRRFSQHDPETGVGNWLDERDALTRREGNRSLTVGGCLDGARVDAAELVGDIKHDLDIIEPAASGGNGHLILARRVDSTHDRGRFPNFRRHSVMHLAAHQRLENDIGRYLSGQLARRSIVEIEHRHAAGERVLRHPVVQNVTTGHERHGACDRCSRGQLCFFCKFPGAAIDKNVLCHFCLHENSVA